MRIGETIATYDVGLALRGKSGKFEITSPTGEIYDVTCKPNLSTLNLEWSNDGTDNSPFFIRKVADGSSLGETKAMTSESPDQRGQSAAPPLPFVVDHALAEGHSPHVANVELLYLEDDPAIGQQSACLYLKSERRGYAAGSEMSMTSRCETFNELDTEIRRLEAQLDEIRSRAKKNFYRTQTAAASA
jgi:hypothetical protein